MSAAAVSADIVLAMNDVLDNVPNRYRATGRTKRLKTANDPNPMERRVGILTAVLEVIA
ncbi:hypothetical protein [Dyella nitratireducens]|uniref:Uncharacterized protein n=1 Tax=Dyella nitratireducens TaxID=1849580 RepID=A0ABQ1FKT2_9GAMM|nr:hypothetical protein [Dyella nitratireducens]GGA17212.1 hypothetical protein GCM10010981_01180 [Dyella nitratireducens]GLQ44821.1 hypothetical protein GCM10007902_46710 [Dyella nitratireducens]